MARRNRDLEVPAAEFANEKFKLEIARELGIPDYDKIDKGDLPARIHGKIGGNMVKRLIMLGQNQMAQTGGAIPTQGDLNVE